MKNILDDERYQLLWIPYNKFENIKELGKGGIMTIYRANCRIDYKDSANLNYSFAFKTFHDQSFFDEVNKFIVFV